MHGPYNSHFREELITTAIVAGILFSGSFALGSQSISKNVSTPPNSSQVLGAETYSEEEVQKLLAELTKTPVATPKPQKGISPITQTSPLQPIQTPLASSSASRSATTTPTYSNTVIEQPYGNGGEYDNLDYRLTIVNPRLVVSASRTFKVDVILANKRVALGLKNRLSATIIKEGEVIAESAPFSLSESATAFPGEQVSFTATMSLISGTDVARLKYLPLVEGVVDTLHDL